MRLEPVWPINKYDRRGQFEWHEQALDVGTFQK